MSAGCDVSWMEGKLLDVGRNAWCCRKLFNLGGKLVEFPFAYVNPSDEDEWPAGPGPHPGGLHVYDKCGELVAGATVPNSASWSNGNPESSCPTTIPITTGCPPAFVPDWPFLIWAKLTHVASFGVMVPVPPGKAVKIPLIYQPFPGQPNWAAWYPIGQDIRLGSGPSVWNGYLTPDEASYVYISAWDPSSPTSPNNWCLLISGCAVGFGFSSPFSQPAGSPLPWYNIGNIGGPLNWFLASNPAGYESVDPFQLVDMITLPPPSFSTANYWRFSADEPE